MSEQLNQQETCQDEALERLEDEAGELSPENLEKIKAEAESIDIGDWAKDEGQKLLAKYMRLRFMASAERTRIKDQLDAMIRGLDARVKALDFVFSAQAEETVRGMLKGQKVKSVKTPWGTAGFRKSAAKLEIVDEAALMQAATEEGNEKFVDLKPVICKAAVNDRFKSTGEVPPGCELIEEQERFFVK